MKTFMTLLILAIIAAASAYFFHPGFRKFVDEKVYYDIPEKSHTSVGYKWQDESGAWQLTQEPPPPGVPYTRVEVRDDWNVMDVPEQLR